MKPRNGFLLIIGLLALSLGFAWYLYPGRQQEPNLDFIATIQQDCAPWDGAAFLVKIPLENGDIIDIAIWEAPTIRLKKTFSFLEEASQRGYANLVHSDKSGEQLVGTVSFAHVDLGSPVKGNFELETIDSGQRFAGQFHAEWLDQIVLCG
jgi:hypothetical protein